MGLSKGSFDASFNFAYLKYFENISLISSDFLTSEYIEEFERLNTTWDSIYDLGKVRVLIILKDGTNLTSWKDLEDKTDVIYISENLSDYVT